MTVCLMGQPGSGRRALAEWLQRQAAEQGDAVATALLDPGYCARGDGAPLWSGPAMEAYGKRLGEVFPRTGSVLAGAPWLNLVAQLAQAAAIHPAGWTGTTTRAA